MSSVYPIIFLEIEYRVYRKKTHNFVISDPQSVEKFVSAIEEAERNRMPARPPRGRLLTDSNDILALMSRRKANAKSVFHIVKEEGNMVEATFIENYFRDEGIKSMAVGMAHEGIPTNVIARVAKKDIHIIEQWLNEYSNKS